MRVWGRHRRPCHWASALAVCARCVQTDQQQQQQVPKSQGREPAHETDGWRLLVPPSASFLPAPFGDDGFECGVGACASGTGMFPLLQPRRTRIPLLTHDDVRRQSAQSLGKWSLGVAAAFAVHRLLDYRGCILAASLRR